MRITSVTIRNYRIHGQLKVDLDRSLTLIGGPNESGKSTLVEAAHRALFLKSRITGEVQKSMVSRIHAGHPEVEVCFDAGAESYRILKRFSGASGTSLLSALSGETWQGDEAETRLAELLGVDAASGGRGGGDRAAQQWAHLWVWQGRAADNPSEHATTQKDSLLARLQASGGAAAMQSEFDAVVAGNIARQHETLFNKNGTPKKDSDLGRAIQEADAARAALTDAQATLAKLQQAVTDSQEADKTIQTNVRVSAKLRTELAGVDDRMAAVVALRREELAQGPAAETAVRSHEALSQGDVRIRKMRLDIQRCTDVLAPQLADTEALTRQESEHAQQAKRAEEIYQCAMTSVRSARLRHELAMAHTNLFQKTAERDVLVNRLHQVQQVRCHLAELEAALATVAVISSAQLKSIQKQEGRCSTAEAALQAMAAGIEVLASDCAVQVGERTLAVGQSEVLTEDTEIAIGDSIRLRIKPGGGNSLSDARAQLQDARRALQQLLDKLGINSTTAAAEACARRQQLEADLKADQAALAGLGADTIDDDVAAARNAQLAAEADVKQRASLVDDFTPPLSAADASVLVTQLAQQLRDAESHESSCKSARDIATANLQDAISALRDHRRTLQQEELHLRDLKVQLDVLLGDYGEDPDRCSKLATLLAERATAERRLAETRKALDALQPEVLESDKVRLERAIAQCDTDMNDAKTKQAVARTILRSDGSVDPQVACDFAAARLRAAHERLSSVQRKAQAVQLLHQLFLDEQRALADQLTRPFAEKITGYLQCLFGAGARVNVRLENNTFAGLEFVRPDQGGGVFSFDSLSAGTKEQVAAAVRLAMAEVLAEGSDNGLPVVFDDAFAYSDPDRVTILQRMLDRAAACGLQIIVLSCNPSDYATLGARSILLRAEPGPPS